MKDTILSAIAAVLITALVTFLFFSAMSYVTSNERRSLAVLANDGSIRCGCMARKLYYMEVELVSGEVRGSFSPYAETKFMGRTHVWAMDDPVPREECLAFIKSQAICAWTMRNFDKKEFWMVEN